MEEKILQTKKNGMTMLLLTLLGYVAAIIVFVLGGILLTAEHNVPGVILMVLGIVWIVSRSKLEAKRLNSTAHESAEKAAQYATNVQALEDRVRVQVAVRAGPKQLPARDAAHQRRGRQGDSHDQRHGALLFQKAEVALRARTLKSGGQHGAAAVHGTDQQHEDIELLAFEIDGRQHHIVVHSREHQRYRDVQQRPAQRRAHRLPLTGLPRLATAAEALKIGVVPVDIHTTLLSPR